MKCVKFTIFIFAGRVETKVRWDGNWKRGSKLTSFRNVSAKYF